MEFSPQRHCVILPFLFLRVSQFQRVELVRIGRSKHANKAINWVGLFLIIFFPKHTEECTNLQNSATLFWTISNTVLPNVTMHDAHARFDPYIEPILFWICSKIKANLAAGFYHLAALPYLVQDTPTLFTRDQIPGFHPAPQCVLRVVTYHARPQEKRRGGGEKRITPEHSALFGGGDGCCCRSGLALIRRCGGVGLWVQYLMIPDMLSNHPRTPKIGERKRGGVGRHSHPDPSPFGGANSPYPSIPNRLNA